MLLRLGGCALRTRTWVRFCSRQPLSWGGNQRPLQGKTAVITGSTSGIGLCVATSLAESGANVTINGLGDRNEISKIVEKLEQHKTRVYYHPANMSKPDEIRSMIQMTAEKLGGVDILVNNAGIQFLSNLEDFPEEKWDDIISVNLTSVFHGMKAAIPYMKNKKWGRIISTSSVHGLVGSKNKSAYVAAKHGVVGITKAAALELAGSGITVNCINPGWVLTPLIMGQIKAKTIALNISFSEASKLLVKEKQPSEEFVTVEQLAGVVLFLCSPAADQITGITLPVDGGWTSQ